ncbi:MULTISPECIES: XRE family transcriptional regulator [Dethiosulfovibrio]|uniref:XRE family transcriptional regulator n=2 Tax=Dethiosulfovibrio TaxID=47054 RepID=A0ABS9EQT6_9BACT|nr:MULTISPECIES: XRE family transcriptional regulator [Dethiosulfovibrio]MCF4114716.1 XRE family transcriptional regulator [Dethiosulfovibrio russensis]MCF4143079.1 XRE family transcriptional regulator [Dethiosulfovibrio marinus]MCF4145221.1 XRE family transcriptional regulator [Dethiosulfovibrio acidaminovorans]
MGDLLAERMKSLRTQAGLNQKDLADMTGLSRNTIINYEGNKRNPDANSLKLIAQALGTTSSYLNGETDDPAPLEPQNKVESRIFKDPSQVGEKVLMIPIVSGVKACCGNGNLYAHDVEWEMTSVYPIRESELIGYSWQTKDFKIIEVEGDSMAPRIEDGAWLLFAAGIEAENGDIVVAMCNGRIMVRGIEFDKEGGITLRAINESYLDKKVREEEEFYVLGTVIGEVPRKGFKLIGKIY